MDSYNDYLGRSTFTLSDNEDKIRYICVCQKGNSPEQVFKVPKFLLSEIKEVFKLYNQEIGLEAAIF